MLACLGIGEPSTGLAESEMGGELRRQPRQAWRRHAARPTGLGGLGGEDLFGEVGEQLDGRRGPSAGAVVGHGPTARAAKAMATAQPPVWWRSVSTSCCVLGGVARRRAIRRPPRP